MFLVTSFGANQTEMSSCRNYSDQIINLISSLIRYPLMLPHIRKLVGKMKLLVTNIQDSFLASETCYHQASYRVACQRFLALFPSLAELFCFFTKNATNLAEMKENWKLIDMNKDASNTRQHKANLTTMGNLSKIPFHFLPHRRDMMISCYVPSVKRQFTKDLLRGRTSFT